MLFSYRRCSLGYPSRASRDANPYKVQTDSGYSASSIRLPNRGPHWCSVNSPDLACHGPPFSWFASALPYYRPFLPPKVYGIALSAWAETSAIACDEQPRKHLQLSAARFIASTRCIVKRIASERLEEGTVVETEPAINRSNSLAVSPRGLSGLPSKNLRI